MWNDIMEAVAESAGTMEVHLTCQIVLIPLVVRQSGVQKEHLLELEVLQVQQKLPLIVTLQGLQGIPLLAL